MFDKTAYDDEFENREVFDASEDDLGEDLEVEMTPEEREAAVQAFFASGGKIKHCPPKPAAETLWLGGKPKVVEEAFDAKKVQEK